MRVVLFNVKFSPNLGDGVIAECLESELRLQLPGSNVTSLDLAGRGSWKVHATGRRRLALLSILNYIPQRTRDIVVSFAIIRQIRRALPEWKRKLAKAEVAVIGGGQLFQDGNLNFPLKLAAAVHECHRCALPFAIFAVGVARFQSNKGRRLISNIVRSPNLFYAAVRDSQSASNYAELGGSAYLCRDPGLLASKFWPAAPSTSRIRPLIGLCVTHPVILRHHSSATPDAISSEPIQLYCAIAVELIASGYDVLCFTNGAMEDELALARLARLLDKRGVDKCHFRIAARSSTPEALARLIAGVDAVIAHRLHATIIAHSYAIPSIGLRWDPKLDAFFASVSRLDHVCTFSDDIVGSIGAHVARILSEGVEPSSHRAALDATENGVAELARAILKMSQKSGQTIHGYPPSGTQADLLSHLEPISRTAE